MRNSAKILICLFFGILLSGCGNVAPTPTATMPTKIVTMQTMTVATVRAQITQTATAVRSPTSTPNAYLTRIAKFTPPAIALTTLEPTQLPAMLQNALSVKTIESFNGHTLRSITGWQYGFAGFTWMDENHLLVRPVIHAEQTGPTAYRFSGRPVVMQLNKNTIWFPPLFHYDKGLPRWSAKLGAIVASENDTETKIYGPDGDLRKTYPGSLISVSPSGAKILTAEERAKVTWIDLFSGKKIIFPSEQISNDFPPVWSPDEMRFYANFHVYGNAKTGEVFEMPSVILDDEPRSSMSRYDHFSGKWVLGDTYLLTLWTANWDWPPKFLTIFDPTMKSYRNLNKLAGIPYDPVEGDYAPDAYQCDTFTGSAQVGGRYVWLNCNDADRLIDMKTFKSKIFSDIIDASLEWSADGNFAFVRHSYDDPSPQLLSGASEQLTPITTKALCYTWHPKQSSFIYMDNQESLSIFNTHNMAIQKTVTLPINFDCPVWNELGNKLIMRGEDDSLWQIDYPTLNHLEQLTQPIKGLKDFASSPDGTLIAFTVGTDIYIVDTSRKP